MGRRWPISSRSCKRWVSLPIRPLRSRRRSKERDDDWRWPHDQDKEYEMRRTVRHGFSKVALGAAGLAGAALLCLTLPTRGQQPTPGLPTPVTDPTIQETVPTAATGPLTRVDYQFALPV